MLSFKFLMVAHLMGLTSMVLAQSNYCRISPSHTLCQYQGLGGSCPAPLRRGVSEAEKAAIVSTHNKLRSRVAQGQEHRGRPGPQRPAADMQEMTWDEELAAVAQRWADQCRFGHDQVRDVDRFKVGQNVYTSGSSRDGPTDWRKGINSWYDEVKLVNNREADQFQFSPSTGHYTQIVWAKTNKVGCGSINYRNGGFINQYMVCNYGPAGNFARSPIYKTGSACSACPAGSSCSQGLCSGGSGGSAPAPAPAPAPIPAPSPVQTPSPVPSRPFFPSRPSSVRPQPVGNGINSFFPTLFPTGSRPIRPSPSRPFVPQPTRPAVRPIAFPTRPIRPRPTRRPFFHNMFNSFANVFG